jgi:DNA-binding transcriptional LysR family regulator
MRSINLDQIRALVTVQECGSVTAAAVQLHLSQPAVTKQLSELEARFGLKVMAKVGRRTLLTPAGLELVELGRHLLEEADGVTAAMRRHSEGWLGRVRVGMSMTMLTHFVPPILRQIRDDHPTIELAIKTALSAEIAAKVFANELDIGIVTLPVLDTSLTVVPYFHDELMVVLPLHHDAPDVITPKYLAGQALILGNRQSALRRMITAWLAVEDLELPKPIMELDNIDGMKSVVGAGLGVSVVPSLSLSGRSAADPSPQHFIVRPLVPPVSRTIGLIERADKSEDRAHTYVRNAFLAARNAVGLTPRNGQAELPPSAAGREAPSPHARMRPSGTQQRSLPGGAKP